MGFAQAGARVTTEETAKEEIQEEPVKEAEGREPMPINAIPPTGIMPELQYCIVTVSICGLAIVALVVNKRFLTL